MKVVPFGKAREEDPLTQTRFQLCIRVNRSKGTMACRGKYQ
jgi:hypothetical protein